MNTDVPLWISVSLIGSQILIVAAIWIGFYRVSRSLPGTGDGPSLAVGIFLIVWLLLAIILGAQGFFSATTARRVPNIAWSFVPLLAGYVWLSYSRPMRTTIDAAPPAWLIGIQVYRILGGVFLILYAQNQLPGVFALPAGIGDVLVGVSAPLIAYLFYAKPPLARPLAILWNIVGLCDLFSALVLGFLSSPSPYQRLALGSPNVLITLFPLVLVPAFAVPVSILLHIFSLRTLLKVKNGPAA